MAQEMNVSAEMKFEFPDAKKIDCKECVFREADRGKVDGASLGICGMYPDGKPVEILFDGEKCEHFIEDK